MKFPWQKQDSTALKHQAEIANLEREPEFVITPGHWYLTDRGIAKVTGYTLGGTGYGHPLNPHFHLGNWWYNIKGQPLRGAPRILAEVHPADLWKHRISATMRVYLCLEYPQHYKLTHQQVAGLQTLMRILLDGETYGTFDGGATLAAHAAEQFRMALNPVYSETLSMLNGGKDWWGIQGTPVNGVPDAV